MCMAHAHSMRIGRLHASAKPSSRPHFFRTHAPMASAAEELVAAVALGACPLCDQKMPLMDIADHIDAGCPQISAAAPSPPRESRVLEDLRQSASCPLCMDTLSDPHCLPCAHAFCKDCILFRNSIFIRTDDLNQIMSCDNISSFTTNDVIKPRQCTPFITQAFEISQWISDSPSSKGVNHNIEFVACRHFTRLTIPLENPFIKTVGCLHKWNLEVEPGT